MQALRHLEQQLLGVERLTFLFTLTEQIGRLDNMNQSADEQRIVNIALNFFKQQTGSDEKAQELLQKLASIVQDEGAKLVNLGNVLFLVMVRGQGIVEIHTIGNEEQPRMLAEDFKQLAAYLKNIGVKTGYTYTEDKRFGRLAKMTGLPVKSYNVKVQGKPMNAYVMEF
jgi:hypothetical protein